MDVDRIFSCSSSEEFDTLALEIFNYQYQHNKVYSDFCDHINRQPQKVRHHLEIPCLPIEFFRSRKVVTGSAEYQLQFTSSGTTGSQRSSHYLIDPQIYQKSYTKAFEHFYGPVEDFCILALLPSYLERKDSSLVYMVADLIEKSKHPLSGFYKDNLLELQQHLRSLIQTKEKILLLGVSFALLDLAEKFPQRLQHTIVMETGGMKGRRKELIREELHSILKGAFGLKEIHSEYGMTELLSQAYAVGSGLFKTPPWMKVVIRDPEDPFHTDLENKSGGINVIDLANLNSCAFIATQDLGKKHGDGSFEVLGRFDNADIRGCNLMVF